MKQSLVNFANRIANWFTKKPKLENVIKVEVSTRHYRAATKYLDRLACPLAMALKEKLKTNNVIVKPYSVIIKGTKYHIVGGWEAYPAQLEGTKDAGRMIDFLIAMAKSGEEITTVELTLEKSLTK